MQRWRAGGAMRSIVCALIFALALALALAGCGPKAQTAVPVFQGRLGDWATEMAADSPERAFLAGVAAPAPDGGRLEDRSAMAAEARRSAAIRRLAELRSLDVRALDADDRLTHAALTERFEALAAAAEFDFGDLTPLGGVRPYVLDPYDSAFVAAPAFLARGGALARESDFTDYLSRLKAAADAIEAETERARADGEAGVVAPGPTIDATYAALARAASAPLAVQPYVSVLEAKVVEAVAAQPSPEAQARWRARGERALAEAEAITRARIVPSLQRAAALMQAQRGRAGEDLGVWRLPEGEAFYRAALRAETTTDYTPDQIHRFGLDRVREASAELDIALRRIGMTEGSVGQRLAQLGADPRHHYADSDEGRAEAFADVEARAGRAMAGAQRWFSALPDAPLIVRRGETPSGRAAAYVAPIGGGAGVYLVDLRDVSRVDRIAQPSFDYGEAAPGRHIQRALARADLPALRRLMISPAFEDGWAAYAQALAEEQGLLEQDPIGRIGYLRAQLRYGALLVIDTGLHAKRWTHQEASAYLADTLGETPGASDALIARAAARPGRSCTYEIGRRSFMRLRDEARTALGPDFDLKSFHDAALREGSLPLPVLEAHVRRWIAARAEERRRS